MKNKTKMAFLLWLLISSGVAFTACEQNNSENIDTDKKYEKIIEKVQKYDETYHPTPEQKRQLDSVYKKGQRKLVDSANRAQQPNPANVNSGTER